MAEGFVHTVHQMDAGRTRSRATGHRCPAPSTPRMTRSKLGEEARRRQTEHVIHNEDGSISERNSYGSDPADRPG